MATYQIMYWHGIPVQVRAGGRRDRISVQMPPRFLAAVDKVAMAARLTGTDAYLEGFEWSDVKERDGSPEKVAASVAAELEARYATIEWRSIAASLREQNSR